MRIFLVLMISASICMGNVHVVSAAVDPMKLADAKLASELFVQLAKDSEMSGQAPRQSDPRVQPLLERVFNPAVLGTTVAPLSDAKSLFELSQNADRVGFIYMLAGTGLTDISKLSSDPKATAIGDRNMVTFAPEIGLWMDFQLDVIRANAASANAFRASVPLETLERSKVKQGLEQVERGVANGTSGIVQAVATNGETVQWQRDRLRRIVEVFPEIAKLIQAEHAAKLMALLKEMDSIFTDTELKADLGKLQQLLSKGDKYK